VNIGTRNDTGVSEVVGEMLMIALVIVLLSVFSAALYNFLPVDRDPSISVMMSNDRQNVTLWHKGGDWVRTDVLKVIVSDAGGMPATYTLKSESPLLPVPDSQAFDLNDNITVRYGKPLAGGEEVVLATDRAVIFSGRVGGGRP